VTGRSPLRRAAGRIKRAVLLQPAPVPPVVVPFVSQCFDAHWYCLRVADANTGDITPWEHYLRIGAPRGEDPCPFFASAWYLEQNPDVAQARFNPLVHYEQHGAREGRSPSPVFDGRWYCRSYGIDPSVTNPLVHYVRVGRALGFATQALGPASRPAQCFDADWYRKTYLTDGEAGIDAWQHYLAVGADKGFDPSPYFSTRWYLENNPDVAAAGVNPLVHYETTGAREGRQPSPKFDNAWYSARYSGSPELTNPLAHFMQIGRAAGFLPERPQRETKLKQSDLFDADWYVAAYPESNSSGISPWSHFVIVGSALGHDPNAFFDVAAYAAQQGTPERDSLAAMRHYEAKGAKAGVNPGPDFDTQWYARVYAAEIGKRNPLAHYLQEGRKAGFHPTPAQHLKSGSGIACFDAEWYLAQHPELVEMGLSPWAHYDAIGWRKGYDPCSHFWTSWYLEHYPDVAGSGMNPLVHYELHGAKEGRAPCPLFDGAWYANHYRIKPDGTNPLAHYLAVGRDRGWHTTERIALDAFKRGDGGFNANMPFHAALDRRIERAGQQAYFDGILHDGRSYAKQNDAPLEETREMKALARLMAEQGAHCLPPYLAEFKDVFIIPGSTVILTRDGIVNDEIFAQASITPPVKQQKLWDRVWVKDDRIAVRYNMEIAPRIKAGIHLFKEHEQNYFHFVCELMPKLHLIEQMGLDARLPLLVSDDLDGRLYDVINAIKAPARKVIKLKRNVPYAVGTLHYLSDLSNVTDVYNAKPEPHHTFLPEATLAAMAKRLTAAVKPQKAVGRKLYLPRDTKRRAILNERAIAEAMLQDGYEIVNVETLTFPAQIALFSSADTIVGGTGAAFTNLLWCRPGTKAVILYPDHEYSNFTFWDRLARTSQVQLTYVLGKLSGHVQGIYGMHDDFTIDLAKLRKALA
jgi:hypothetical protein